MFPLNEVDIAIQLPYLVIQETGSRERLLEEIQPQGVYVKSIPSEILDQNFLRCGRIGGWDIRRALPFHYL